MVSQGNILTKIYYAQHCFHQIFIPSHENLAQFSNIKKSVLCTIQQSKNFGKLL